MGASVVKGRVICHVYIVCIGGDTGDLIGGAYRMGVSDVCYCVDLYG